VLRITVTAREAIPSATEIAATLRIAVHTRLPLPSAIEIAATLRIAVHARLPLPSADAAQNPRMEGDARDERIIE
jgi:hypothetical protein